MVIAFLLHTEVVLKWIGVVRMCMYVLMYVLCFFLRFFVRKCKKKKYFEEKLEKNKPKPKKNWQALKPLGLPNKKTSS